MSKELGNAFKKLTEAGENFMGALQRDTEELTEKLYEAAKQGGSKLFQSASRAKGNQPEATEEKKPAELPNCDLCGKPQHAPGAILLSPPDSEGKVRKLHCCTPCWGGKLHFVSQKAL